VCARERERACESVWCVCVERERERVRETCCECVCKRAGGVRQKCMRLLGGWKCVCVGGERVCV